MGFFGGGGDTEPYSLNTVGYLLGYYALEIVNAIDLEPYKPRTLNPEL